MEDKQDKKIDSKGEVETDVKFSFFTNAVRVRYNETEFLIEFFQLPEKEENFVDSIRVYVTAQNFKSFSKLFKEMWDEYETKFKK